MSKMRFFALQELSNRGPLEVITPSNKLSDYYGSHVFDRKKMQEYLPKEAYKAVTDAIEKGTPISREMADLIANGMKSWAKSLNVTHYTHCLSSKNRTLPLSLTEVSATRSKRADILLGTSLHRLS